MVKVVDDDWHVKGATLTATVECEWPRCWLEGQRLPTYSVRRGALRGGRKKKVLIRKFSRPGSFTFFPPSFFFSSLGHLAPVAAIRTLSTTVVKFSSENNPYSHTTHLASLKHQPLFTPPVTL